MKRFICIILSVFLIFMCPLSVYADDQPSHGGGVGSRSDYQNWGDWSWDDKLAFILANGVDFVSHLYKVDLSGSAEHFTNLMNARAVTMGYDNYASFLARHTSYNQTTNNMEFDNDAMTFINEIKSEIEAEAEYIYMYPLKPDELLVGSFPSRATHDFVVEFMNAYPDRYFYIVNGHQDYAGGPFDGLFIYSFSRNLSGITNNPDTLGTLVSLYDYDNYNPVFQDGVQAFFLPWVSSVNYLKYVNASGVISTLFFSDGAENFDFSNVLTDKVVYVAGGSAYWGICDVAALRNAGYLYLNPDPENATIYFNRLLQSYNTYSTIFSATQSAVPVFRSMAALKNGVDHSVGFKPGNNYQYNTPITNNTISSTVINNIINNNTTNNDYGSDQDYTDVLNSILQHLQQISNKLDGIDPEECDHSDILAYLQPLSAQLDSLYEQMSFLIDKIDISNQNTSDILAALNNLSGNIESIKTSLESIDAAMDKLDQMQETLDDMKALLQDTNDKVTDIKDILTGIDSDVSDMVQDISNINLQITYITENMADSKDFKKYFKDLTDELKNIGEYIQALGYALVGDDEYKECLNRVRIGTTIPDDFLLASVDQEAAALYDNHQSTFGGALGQVFTKLLDFQIGIDDLVQDEEYIDEVEQLLRDLLAKVDPEKDEDDDDSLFERILRQIELKLQVNANKVREIEETSKTKFPFSIGYDLEALLLLFAAEPVAPVFTVPFRYPRISFSYDFEIDFTQFTDAVGALRWFITVIWTFGLLKLTPAMAGLSNESES